jgi:hypothetical protein
MSWAGYQYSGSNYVTPFVSLPITSTGGVPECPIIINYAYGFPLNNSSIGINAAFLWANANGSSLTGSSPVGISLGYIGGGSYNYGSNYFYSSSYWPVNGTLNLSGAYVVNI